MGDPFGGGWGAFDPYLNQKAREYLASKSADAGRKIFKEATKEIVKTIAKNPQAVQPIAQTVETNLARVGMQQATRVAARQLLRQVVMGVGRAALMTGGAVAVVAAVIVAAYIVAKLYEAANNAANEIQRRNMEMWKQRAEADLKDTVKDHCLCAEKNGAGMGFLPGQPMAMAPMPRRRSACAWPFCQSGQNPQAA